MGRRSSLRRSGATASRIRPTARQRAATFIATTSPRERLSQVTNTPEAEYSPTVTPDRRHISVIRVEADGTQRLWRFAIRRTGERAGAGAARHQARRISRLGRATRARVVRARPAGSARDASGGGHADRPGSSRGDRYRPSIQRIPGGGISFVLARRVGRGPAAGSDHQRARPGTRQTRPLVRAPAGATEADTAWTPDGLLLVPFEGQLFGWRARRGRDERRSPIWRRWAAGVTRLAISPKGDRIALVAQKP